MLMLVVWLVWLCSEVAATSPVQKPEDQFQYDAAAVQTKFNYFDADLLEALSEQEKGNFVISPSSIKTLLGLILEGAEGSTKAELLSVLRLPQNMTYARKALSFLQNSIQKTTNPEVTIDSVAQIFIANSLKTNSTYAKLVKDYYRADVSPQDFNSPEVATNNINSWIRTRTGSLITELIDQDMINAYTYAILTSAIYFNGKWKNEFPIQDTKNECFFTEPNLQCQMTPTMSKNEELHYKLDQSLDSHVLQIPYKDERFSMVIILPRKRDGMKQLLLEASRIYFPLVLEKMELFEVNLKLPRFNMYYGTELISLLKKLNLKEVFAENAQIPYMIDGNPSRVSAMVHKAKIQVNEKGTKAAAASAAAVVPLMFGLTVVNVEVNHPFLYFIYDNQSNTVLFSGRLSSVEASTANEPETNNEFPDLVPLGAPDSTNQPNSYAAAPRPARPNNQQAPAGSPGPYNQRPYAAPAGSSRQPISVPSNQFGPNNQPHAAQPNSFGSSRQPSRVPPSGASYQPVAGESKPSYHGPVNHQYSQQRPTAQPTRGPPYKEFQYPAPSDDNNYAQHRP